MLEVDQSSPPQWWSSTEERETVLRGSPHIYLAPGHDCYSWMDWSRLYMAALVSTPPTTHGKIFDNIALNGCKRMGIAEANESRRAEANARRVVGSDRNVGACA